MASAAPRLSFHRSGPIAWLVADNEARLNAWTLDMWRRLPALVREAAEDAGIRVIVLRGAGERAFSAGADISEFDSLRTGETAHEYDAAAHAAFDALFSASKPTIAMVHGFCLGGGLCIALACDLRLADDAALFSIPAARLGIGFHPRWVKVLLGAVRPAQAKDMLFTGRRVSAAEALAMGLVHRVWPSGALMGETEALAETIGANAPLTIHAAKAAIDALARDPDADLAPLEALANACFASADYAEGKKAFGEKRTPRFTGR